MAVLSHDIKTPLTAIQLYNSLLSDMGPEDPDRAAYHRIIDDQVAWLAHMADTVLGGVKQGNPGAGLTELLNNTACVYHRLHAGRGYSFVLEVPDHLAAVTVDRCAIERVLNNLLDNAIKYSIPHTIRIRASEEYRGLERFVAIEVTDRGRGIDRRFLGRIFEPQYRVDPNGEIAGSGLGLAIVRDIVETRGGRLEVATALGEGSTFRFLLPTAFQTQHNHAFAL